MQATPLVKRQDHQARIGNNSRVLAWLGETYRWMRQRRRCMQTLICHLGGRFRSSACGGWTPHSGHGDRNSNAVIDGRSPKETNRTSNLWPVLSTVIGYAKSRSTCPLACQALHQPLCTTLQDGMGRGVGLRSLALFATRILDADSNLPLLEPTYFPVRHPSFRPRV